jgi:gliding motility-associated-like protein
MNLNIKILILAVVLIWHKPLLSQCANDLTPPDPQIVDSLSYDPVTGNLIIGWQENTAGDACWYYIFYKNPITGSNDIIDSVPANASGLYTYNITGNNALNQVEAYAIGVKDCCNNQMFTILDYHRSMLLQGTLDKCDTAVNLIWNAYKWFNSGTNVLYQVYVSQNGNPFAYLGSTTDTIFQHKPVGDNSVNTYYIRAVENGGAGPFTASSTVFSITIDLLNPVQFLDLYTVSVKDSSTVTITFIPDITAGTKKYYIKRAYAESHVFTDIQEVPYTPSTQITVYDATAKPAEEKYKYEIWAEDSCGKFSKKSNLGTNILLKAQADNLLLKNSLTWNNYRNWKGGVNQYNIYRAQDSPNGYYQLVDRIFVSQQPAKDTNYTYVDDVTDFIDGNGKFCYYIEAEETTTDHYGVAGLAYSYSNKVCVDLNPIVYIPNAFNPLSEVDKNRIFIPIAGLYDKQTFELTIYDRWGHELFYSNDYTIGWNGKDKNNKLCPTGVYIYKFNISTVYGEPFEYNGRITLIY